MSMRFYSGDFYVHVLRLWKFFFCFSSKSEECIYVQIVYNVWMRMLRFTLQRHRQNAMNISKRDVDNVIVLFVVNIRLQCSRQIATYA